MTGEPGRVEVSMTPSELEAYTLFVRHQISEPDAPIIPRLVAHDAVHEDDLEAAVVRLATMRTGQEQTLHMVADRDDYPMIRELAREVLSTSLTMQINHWMEGGSAYLDSLEFAQLRPAAQTVADAHGVDIADVFHRPEEGINQLYVEAYQRAFPGGPSEVVARRIASAQQQGYQETRDQACRNMLLKYGTAQGPLNLEHFIATATPAARTGLEYTRRLLTLGGYERAIATAVVTGQYMARRRVPDCTKYGRRGWGRVRRTAAMVEG